MFGIDDMALATVAAPIVGGLLGMGTSSVSSGLNYKQQVKLMNLQNAWSEKMNAQQQGWQEAMWNANNEYNTASNQMQRMMEAGINPNAAANAVAGVNASSQLAAQPSIPNSASGQLSAPLDLTSGALGMMQAVREYGMYRKQKELMDSQIDDLDATAKLKNYQSQTEQERRENVKANTEVLKGQAKMVKLQSKQIKAQIKNEKLRSQYQEWVNNVLNPLLEQGQTQQNENLRKSYEEATARIEQIGASIETLKAQRADLYASANLKDKQASLVEKQAEGQGIQNEVAQIDKQIKDLERQRDGVKTGLVKAYGFDPGTTGTGQQGIFLIHRVFSLLGDVIHGSMRRSVSSDSYLDNVLFDSNGLNPSVGGYSSNPY